MTRISVMLKAAPLAMIAIYFSLLLPAIGLAHSAQILPDAVAPFINDSHADISFRNQFKNLNTQDYGERQVQTAWGQGITLDYRSGYFADIIGIDTSYYSVCKLAASDDFSGRSILYNDKGKAKGFHKFGQLFAKFKLEGENSHFNLYSGWQKIHKWGAITNSSRAIPSTYQGWRADAGIGPMTLRGAWLTRYSDRGSPRMIHFETADRKKKIGQLYTTELIYKDRDYSAAWFVGESHHYLQRHGLEVGWQPESLASRQVKALGMLYINRALKEWRAMSADYRPFDNNGWHPAFYVEWRQHAWKHKVGASYTRAKLKDRLGYFERHMAKNSRGTFNSMADAWGNDYVGDNEKMLAWTTEYFITPRFKLGLQSGYGWGMQYQGNKIKRGEAILFSQWKPEKINHLSLQLSGGPSWNYQNKHNRPILADNGKPKRAQNHAIEFQVDYAFNLF